MMSTDSFFESLDSVEDFHLLADPAVYRNLPDDWAVAAADIRNSTQAIAEGKYREVNALTAALITAVVNAIKPVKIPFVFGGDGACFCVPEKYRESAAQTMTAVKRMAREIYGFDLRIGIFQLSEIKATGKTVGVAKQKLSEFCVQAAFSGGGIEWAEQQLKKLQEPQNLESQHSGCAADFSGFECRWNTFKSPDREVAALLVKALRDSESPRVYKAVLGDLEKCFGRFDLCQPLKESEMKAAVDARKLSPERRIRTFEYKPLQKIGYGMFQLFQVVLGILCMKFKIRFGKIDWGNYKRQAILNSDVKKFDDQLRFVISGNRKQLEDLARQLESRRLKGELAYGIHISDAAIMTCYVVDYAGEHYHFVDGAGGGYARAALMLKEQLKLSA